MKNLSKRKLLAAVLSVSFVMQQSAFLSVYATDITGITGNNGIYNIDPSDIKGDTGFRQYEISVYGSRREGPYHVQQRREDRPYIPPDAECP